MNLGMAGFAKSHQVLSIMRAALGEGLYMVYLLGWCVDTVLKTSLTKRVGSSIAVTDTFPCTSVATLSIRVSVILLVAFGFLLFMLRTEASVCQIRATGIGAGTFWLSWHRIPPSVWV
jgi:hypothetical protein